MKNGKPQQCPKGIKVLVESLAYPAVAKGRKSRTRRLETNFVPGDRIVAKDDEGIIIFELSVNCFGKVSTVIPLDK